MDGDFFLFVGIDIEGSEKERGGERERATSNASMQKSQPRLHLFKINSKHTEHQFVRLMCNAYDAR